MKKTRRERGSVTVIVFATITFILITISAILTTVSLKRKAQIKETKMLQDAYGGDMETVYYDQVEKIAKTSEAEGDQIQLKNTYAGKLENYKIYGNTIQDGTPTVENPVKINSVGEENNKITVKSCGKNLISIQDMNIKYTNDYYLNIFPDNPKLLLEENTTYTITFEYKVNFNSSSSIGCGIGYGDTHYRRDIIYMQNYENNMAGKFKYTFTTPLQFDESYGTPYLQLRLSRTYVKATIDVDIKNIQLEKSDTSSEFEPYRENLQTISLAEPLRKLGDVADYIDYKNGRVVRYIKKITFDKNSIFSQWPNTITDTSSGVYYSNSSLLGTYPNNIGLFSNNIGMCTHFVLGTGAYSTDQPISFCLIPSSSPPYIGFRIPYTKLEDFYTFLDNQKNAGTPVEVYFAYKNPTYEPINLQEITTYNSITNITIESEISPSKIEVEY